MSIAKVEGAAVATAPDATALAFLLTIDRCRARIALAGAHAIFKVAGIARIIELQSLRQSSGLTGSDRGVVGDAAGADIQRIQAVAKGVAFDIDTTADNTRSVGNLATQKGNMVRHNFDAAASGDGHIAINATTIHDKGCFTGFGCLVICTAVKVRRGIGLFRCPHGTALAPGKVI